MIRTLPENPNGNLLHTGHLGSGLGEWFSAKPGQDQDCRMG
jgi:hypothetical protein